MDEIPLQSATQTAPPKGEPLAVLCAAQCGSRDKPPSLREVSRSDGGSKSPLRYNKNEKAVICLSLPYDKSLISRAKALRKNATPQENHLWYDFLRTYPVKFQRQKTIDRFIVDFYCHAAKIVIELDGSQHYTEQNQIYDRERTMILQKYELSVIRFSNYEIDTQFSSVCEAIDNLIKSKVIKP